LTGEWLGVVGWALLVVYKWQKVQTQTQTSPELRQKEEKGGRKTMEK
jgi:hypothetical protein